MYLFEYKDIILNNSNYEDVISVTDFYTFCSPFEVHNYNPQTDTHRLFYLLTKDGYKLQKKTGNSKSGTLRSDKLWHLIRNNKIHCPCGKRLDVIGIKKPQGKFKSKKKNKFKRLKEYQNYKLYHYEPITVNYINGEWIVEKLTADHIIPKSKGGGNHHSNIQLMCKKCNELKGDKIC